MIAQASAIPYAIRDGQVQVLLITSRSGRDWIFPKGIIDPGETAEQTAAKETFEEAGVRGAVAAAPLGRYRYTKWGTALEVQVYLLRVEETLDEWPEMNVRRRRWLTPAEAARRLKPGPLRALFDRAVAALAGDPPPPAPGQSSG